MTPADPHLLTPALIRRTLTYRWVCLGLLFVSGLLAFFTRLAPAVVIPDLREAFALNAAELGLLTSLYLWPFALVQPVAGVLTDRFGSRRTVTAFLAVAGVGQVLFAFAPSLFGALVGRALTGLGASILYVGAARIMAQWFRPREFGTLTGAWTSVANLGALTAAAPLVALITLAGWRPSLGGVGVVMLATAVLIYLLVRDNPSERGLPSLAEIDGLPESRRVTRSMSLGEGLLVVLREPNTWLLGSYAFLLFGTMTMMQGLWAVRVWADAAASRQHADSLGHRAHRGLHAVGLPGRQGRGLAQARGACGSGRVCPPLGASRSPPGRAAARRAMGGDALGRVLRLDLDSIVCAAQGLGPARGGRHRHGDPQSLLLARRRRLSASQRADRVGVSPARRTHARRGLSGGVLVVPGFRGSQHHPLGPEPRTPARAAARDYVAAAGPPDFSRSARRRLSSRSASQRAVTSRTTAAAPVTAPRSSFKRAIENSMEMR